VLNHDTCTSGGRVPAAYRARSFPAMVVVSIAPTCEDFRTTYTGGYDDGFGSSAYKLEATHSLLYRS
jgi:hypothetical protein